MPSPRNRPLKSPHVDRHGHKDSMAMAGCFDFTQPKSNHMLRVRKVVGKAITSAAGLFRGVADDGEPMRLTRDKRNRSVICRLQTKATPKSERLPKFSARRRHA